MLNTLLNTLLASVTTPPNFWMPEGASTVSRQIDGIFDFITWLCIVFFVLIVVLMVYFVVKYRRPDVHHKAEGSATHNTPLELTWTIIPLILVIAIFYVGMEGYINLRVAPAGAYEVHVTGQKWYWSFDHAEYGCSESDVLRVPVNRPVKLIMSSQDVLHAFFIPEFRVKQDVVPGRITTLWFEATKVGTYTIFCAEYCGTDHSQMVGRVEVYDEDEFKAQMEECANWIDDPEYDGAGLYKAGERLFSRCRSCHTINGATGTGPTWDGLWVRTEEGSTVFTDGDSLSQTISDGDYNNAEDYLYQSIVNPKKHIVENFSGAMPAFQGQLKDKEIRALIEYIKAIDAGKVDDAGKIIN